jgi:hypothetical protein
MKHITSAVFIVSSFTLPLFALAVTAEESLVVQGRSIPENSISISPPATTIPSAELVKTSPVSVPGTLVTETMFGVAGKPFVLDGTKSHDDGIVRTYSWRQVEGPKVSLSNANSLMLTVVPSVAGVYVFDLVATDSTGKVSVVRRSTFTVDATGPAVKVTPPPPRPSPSPSGDPDFDLLRVAVPSSVSAGDVNRDGVVDVVTKKVPPPPAPSSGLSGSDSGVSEVGDKLNPSAATKGAPDHTRASDSSAGKGSAGEREAIGDPDFDLLDIHVDGNDLESIRARESSSGTTKNVIVRGWDPEKKEEIVARPEEVKTSEDLQMYVEAVALSDTEIKEINIKKDAVVVESREPGKLFGFIPVHLMRTVEVKFDLKDSTEDPVDVEFSWWHVFVKKSESTEDLTEEIKTELSLLKMEDMKRVRTESKISTYARTLQVLSNVMKTKHDTVKNSISNVR